jgi:hypothetical protein
MWHHPLRASYFHWWAGNHSRVDDVIRFWRFLFHLLRDAVRPMLVDDWYIGLGCC